jgi:hypothetical protein
MVDGLGPRVASGGKNRAIDRRRFIQASVGSVLAAGNALLAACDNEVATRGLRPLSIRDDFTADGWGLGDRWFTVRYGSSVRRARGRAVVRVDPAPHLHLTPDKKHADYIGEPFVIMDSRLSAATAEVEIVLRGKVEAGLIVRWNHDHAYALVVNPDEATLCRYATADRVVLDRVELGPGSRWRLRLEVNESVVRAAIRGRDETASLRAQDDDPLGPGLVGLAVNAADSETSARVEFSSFRVTSDERPSSLDDLAFRYTGAVIEEGSDYKAIVAARTVIPAPLSFEVAEDADFTDARTIGPVRPLGRLGACRTELGGLRPARRYHWRPIMGSGERGDAASFRTPGGPGAPVTFAFASCTSGRATSYPSFETAAGFDPDFYLHAGDWGYADLNSYAHRADHFQARWIRLLREENAAQLLRNTALLFWQDDHDYQADNGWSKTVKPYAVKAFDELHANPTDDYFDLRWGDVHVFCIDCRLYATDPDDADDGNKSRLGSEQKSWLKLTMRESDAPVLVVASPMAFRNKVDDDPGWHNTYTTEREELLSFFASLDPTVVILSGDAHGHRLIHHFEYGDLFEVHASGTDFGTGAKWAHGNNDPDHTLINITDRTGFALVDLDAAGPDRKLRIRSVSTSDGSTMFEKVLPVNGR